MILEGFQQLKITGKYDLIHFNEKELIVKQQQYKLSCEAKDLQIEELSEEQLIVTCSSINNMTITQKADAFEES